jgi:polyprenyldihydroxybenzoate methyltransferase/3-demethylubiquinol 3-O-methyltransferase
MEFLIRKSPNQWKQLGTVLLNSNKNLSRRFLSSSRTPKNLLVENQQKLSISNNALFSTTSKSKSPNTIENFQSTADEKEINKFKLLSNAWWTEGGEFDALHRMNRLRVPMIRDAMVNYLETMPKAERDKINATIAENGQEANSLSEPLAGLNILDIGCGGGILSEALARLGAVITGVDACKENIIAAQMRAQTEFEKSREQAKFYKRLRYLHCTVEELAAVEENSGFFDAVVMSEVIEHVNNVSTFVENSALLLKNHGYMFATTINKTPQSYALAIIGAEYVLNLVPRGTHDWNKFITPSNLKDLFQLNEISTRFEMGMCFNPLTKNWSWVQDQSVNYAIYGQKLKTSL